MSISHLSREANPQLYEPENFRNRRHFTEDNLRVLAQQVGSDVLVAQEASPAALPAGAVAMLVFLLYSGVHVRIPSIAAWLTGEAWSLHPSHSAGELL